MQRTRKSGRKEPPRVYDRATGEYRPVPRGTRTPPDFAACARSRAEARRRHRRRALLLFNIFLFVAVLAVAAALSLTVLFRASAVRVTGSSRYPARQIAAASGIRTGDNLFLIQTGRAAAKIKGKFPYLGEVSVLRRFPSEVEIRVAEEPVCGAVAYGKKYIVAGADGRALEIADRPPKGCAVLKGLGVKNARAGAAVEFTGGGTAELVRTVSDAFRKGGLDRISSVDFSQPSRILAVYDGRVTINFGLPSDLDYKIRFARKLLSENIKPTEKGTLNMSVAPETDKAYFDPAVAG
ncbi:MAG TPA: cell division protein FtsQ [Ruminococcaceae bacterium]|jgi:hypothetical protein|nr:cell division protein FtsQ [Oscillospiraceae bacterium]HBQ46512.1 cell division protein FtsQ [Oscillospiraceae bacterium]HBT91360.1 cell division protein FtsQ [Oscillospiraceae bacterium]HCB91493.1 cell division protein FtsQ [Oscillospiraceae bacterium]